MKTIEQKNEKNFDAEGNEVHSHSEEHECEYDEICIEVDAYDVIYGIRSIKVMWLLFYLFQETKPGSGVIVIDEDVFQDVETRFGMNRRTLLYNLGKLAKLGLLDRIDEIVHTYSGYREYGALYYRFNMDRVVKQYDGTVFDMNLSHKSASNPKGRLLYSRSVLTVHD